MAWTVIPKVMGKLAYHLGEKNYHVNLALYTHLNKFQMGLTFNVKSKTIKKHLKIVENKNY